MLLGHINRFWSVPNWILYQETTMPFLPFFKEELFKCQLDTPASCGTATVGLVFGSAAFHFERVNLAAAAALVQFCSMRATTKRSRRGGGPVR